MRLVVPSPQNTVAEVRSRLPVERRSNRRTVVSGPRRRFWVTSRSKAAAGAGGCVTESGRSGDRMAPAARRP
jgi:hypothetical protein